MSKHWPNVKFSSSVIFFYPNEFGFLFVNHYNHTSNSETPLIHQSCYLLISSCSTSWEIQLLNLPNNQRIQECPDVNHPNLSLNWLPCIVSFLKMSGYYLHERHGKERPSVCFLPSKCQN